MKERAVEALRLAAGGDRGVARRLHAGDVGAADLVVARQNLSLLDPIAVIVVRHAAKLAEAACEVLAESLAASPAGPPLVFWDDGFRNRRGLFGELARVGAEVEFRAPKRPEAIAWIAEEARRLGLRLAPGVADEIFDLVGANLLMLRSTLEVLSLAAGDERVDREMAAQVVPAARERALYELQDAVAEGQGGRAVRLFRDALDGGQAPPLLVGALFAEVRRLLLARDLDPRIGRPEAAQVLGAPPFKVSRIIERAKRFPRRKLLRAVERLADIDVDLKTGGGEPIASLEEWILELAAR